MAAKSFDLGPGSAYAFFKIKDSAWTAINRRAYLCSCGEMGGCYYAYRTTSCWDELVLRCRDWVASTFASLQSLTGDIGAAATRLSSGPLKTLSEGTAAAGPLSERKRDEIRRQLVEMNDELSALVSKAAVVKEAVEAFAEVNDQADTEMAAAHFATRWWNAIRPAPGDVGRALVTLHDGFDALCDSLENCQVFLEQCATESELDAEVDFALARSQWQDAVNLARGMQSRLDEQKIENLSGEWLYTEQPVINEQWRGILPASNPYLALWAKKVDELVLDKKKQDNTKALWSFRRVEAGWWQILNQGLGERGFLTAPDPEGPGPWAPFCDERRWASEGFATESRAEAALVPDNSQLWRVMVASEMNAALINALTGEKRVLGFDGKNRLVMVDGPPQQPNSLWVTDPAV